MHGQCSIWNMLIYINIYIYIYVHVPLGGILKAENSPDRHPRLDSWTCGPGGEQNGGMPPLKNHKHPMNK